MKDIRYGFKRHLDLPVEEAEQRLRAGLMAEGFGVLTEIDVRATLKAKLGVEGTPYKILGACNPPVAHRALSAEPDLGLFLPCSLIVYESSPGRSVIAASNPLEMMRSVENETLAQIAVQVAESMKRVIDSV